MEKVQADDAGESGNSITLFPNGIHLQSLPTWANPKSLGTEGVKGAIRKPPCRLRRGEIPLHNRLLPPIQWGQTRILEEEQAMQTGKRLWALMCCMLMIFLPTAQAAQPLESGTPMTLTTPSAILAETATGTVIFEKNADERREVASITKLMTALLVLEALDRDEIALTDSVQISPRAAAMKGSQALLDANAVYPLEDLLRTTIMASANDSAVALSEYIAGSEENFVDRMNRRAAELGMTNTNYVNCTGYPQSGQYTTARDVCRLCCEIAKHPRYNQYASVWIDKLTHPGGRVTDLTNTNRLVRFYEGCDGYKTGSTDAAKYCLAATAEKNGMRLVAIVLGTPVSQTRFNEARQMLDYGFATYRRVVIANKGDLLGQNVEVRGGSAERVPLALGSGLSMLLKNGQQSGLSLSVQLPESVDAPIAQGDVIGLVDVLLDGQVIAKLNCVAAEDVPRPGFIEGLLRILRNWR
ncbi:MAG: D-alanyl-D-alanine carboxypeptidase [Clostridiales bacterium]|nr:D-alanyl-D-alanine carboxypeptidase [Clostridiales bacterium]